MDQRQKWDEHKQSSKQWMIQWMIFCSSLPQDADDTRQDKDRQTDSQRDIQMENTENVITCQTKTNAKVKETFSKYLFFALQLLFDFPTELGQQDLPAVRHEEQFRVDEIFDARHLGLRQSSQGNVPDDFQDVNTGRNRNSSVGSIPQ